jgi:hypothetical protein
MTSKLENKFFSIKNLSKIIDRKTDLNYQNFNGDTLLMFAVESDNIKLVKKLIDAHANVNINNDFYHYSPLSIACENNFNDIIHLLLSNNANIHYSSKDIIIKDHSAVKSFLLNLADTPTLILSSSDTISPSISVFPSLDLYNIMVDNDNGIIIKNTNSNSTLHKSKILGKGRHGIVYLFSSVETKSDESLALKITNNYHEIKITKSLQNFKHSLSHVCPFKYVSSTDSLHYILMPVMDGDFHSNIVDILALSDISKLNLLFTISSQIKTLYDNGFSYSDLKLSNILFKSSFSNLFLGDIGSICKNNSSDFSCSFFSYNYSKHISSFRYNKIINKYHITSHDLVWSLLVLLFNLYGLDVSIFNFKHVKHVSFNTFDDISSFFSKNINSIQNSSIKLFAIYFLKLLILGHTTNDDDDFDLYANYSLYYDDYYDDSDTRDCLQIWMDELTKLM